MQASISIREEVEGKLPPVLKLTSNPNLQGMCSENKNDSITQKPKPKPENKGLT